jgi:molecular chaperone GrpE
VSDDTLDDPMDALDDAGEGGDGDRGGVDRGQGDATVGETDGAGEYVDVRQELADEIERVSDDGDGDAAGGVAGEEVEALREDLAEREDRIDELESRLKRVQADFENYKKRAERKREEFATYATVDLISELLEIRDDLDRALDSEGDIREGVELVAESLDDVLDGEGVERIDVEGTTDPEEHEVMMQVDSEEHDEGEIVDVYEPGYRMEDRVIRPAKVTVASGESSGDDADAADGDGGDAS